MAMCSTRPARHSTVRALVSTSLFLLACSAPTVTGCAGDTGGMSLPPIRSTPPSAPSSDDRDYSVTARSWLLLADGLTDKDDYEVTVRAPDVVRFIDVWLDGGEGFRLEAQ